LREDSDLLIRAVVRSIETKAGKKNKTANRPDAFVLYPNYPNPFNAGTTIEYDIHKSGEYIVEVLDITGRVIRSWPAYKSAGSYRLLWDGLDEEGHALPGGVYLLQIRNSLTVQLIKLTFLK